MTRTVRLYGVLLAFLICNPGARAQAARPAAGKTIEERLLAVEARLAQLEERLDRALQDRKVTLPPGETPTSDVGERFEALDQKIRILERRRELEQEEAAAQAKEKPALAAGREGFSIRSGDGAYQLRFRGYAHVDSRLFVGDAPASSVSTFVIRRARPLFEATLARNIDFRIMPDFGDGKAVIQDLYFDVRLRPGTAIRAGRFKPPLGLERLQSATDLQFAERALPTALVPNRDIGVQLSGDLWRSALTYAVGVFNGVPDGASSDADDGNSKDLVGRLFTLPFKSARHASVQNLGVGIAGSVGNREGIGTSLGSTGYKTTGQQSFFRYRTDAADGAVTASGTLYRISPQGYYYHRSLGVLAEYVLSSHSVRRGTNLRRLDNNSWQFTGSYVLTGENASYRGVVPKRSFDRRSGGWGALEIVGRYGELRVDPQAFPLFANPQTSAKTARALAVGLNWYPNRNLKLVLNYERTGFSGGALSGDRAPEHVLVTRAQVAY